MAQRSSSESDCEWDPTMDEPENESDFSDSECSISDEDEMYEDAPEPVDQPEPEGVSEWTLLSDFHTDKWAHQHPELDILHNSVYMMNFGNALIKYSNLNFTCKNVV